MKLLIRIFLFALAFAVPMAGCDTDKLHDLNINPQAMNTVDVNYIFTAAELGTASGGAEGDNRYIDWRTNINLCAYAIQQLASTGAPGDKYFDNQETWAAPWEFLFGGQLKNLNEVIKQTGPGGYSEGKKLNTRQAARIMRAYNFARLTDYYGHIPYTDAIKGIEGTFLPTYTPQDVIYADLLKELGEAVSAISAANADEGFAQADIIFNGNVDRWKRFGNTLILRLAMRMSFVNATGAGPFVTQALSGAGVMQSNLDNAWVPMATGPSQWTNQNGISRVFLSGDGGVSAVMSKTLLDKLLGPDQTTTADDDPRLFVYTSGILKTDGTFEVAPLMQRGMPNGLDAGTLDGYYATLTPPVASGTSPNAVFSQMQRLLLQIDDPYMLMNYAEAELLQAEAAQRGIGTVAGTAQAHYDAGVKAAMQMFIPYAQGNAADAAKLTVTDAQVTSYLTMYPYLGAAGGLEQIGTQMWLSKYLNWWDAWSDWRRTTFPTLVEINYPGNLTGGKIPTKLNLPSHEIATNIINVEAGATKPYNVPTGKVWWDVN